MGERVDQNRRRVEFRLAVLLIIAYGWLFVFFPRLNNPNELVRLYMARALAEHGTYVIGERIRLPTGATRDTGPIYEEWGWINDKALVCTEPGRTAPDCAGKLYAGKAPGPSLLSAPIVFAQNELTRVVLARAPTKSELVFVLRWLLAILPSVALWLAVRRFLRAFGVDPPLALIATLAGALGSLSFTFGQMVASHQLASVFLALGFLAGFWPGPGSTKRSLLVGLGLFGAVCMEYPSAPAAVLVGLGWLLVQRPSLRLLAISAAGALPFTAALLHFHSAAFGSVFRTAYSVLENPSFVRDLAPGLVGVSLFSGERVWGSLFSPYLGLFHWAPWCAVALGALFLEKPRAAKVAGAVVLYFLLFQVNHSLWRSGWTVGPRYITPLVPFAAILVALALQQLKPEARVAGVAVLAGAAIPSMVATVLASMVAQGFPFEAYNPLREVVWPLFSHGYVARNLLQALGVPGLWSALPVLLALALSLLLCATAPLAQVRLTRTSFQKPDLVAARTQRLMWLVASGFLVAQWTAIAGATPEGPKGAAFLAAQWEPPHPPGAVPFE